MVLHGRNLKKIEATVNALSHLNPESQLTTVSADLSNMQDVEKLASWVTKNTGKLDVLINNAGVFKLAHPIAASGFDQRFLVNTIAPYLLTIKLLDHLNFDARIVNLSSAAQAPVNIDSLLGRHHLSDSNAYAQSKLALTMWSFEMAKAYTTSGPAIISINPASFLGSKMVKEAYGTQGKDLSIGADVLVNAAISDSFSNASGKYFDNDIGNWTHPHPDAMNSAKCQLLIATLDDILQNLKVKLD